VRTKKGVEGVRLTGAVPVGWRGLVLVPAIGRFRRALAV
jgi:hypothetical protein